jgi:hypothetical protein
MGGNVASRGNGYGNGYNGYAPYGYGPGYGYAPYGAPAAPVATAPQVEAPKKANWGLP